LPKLRRNRWIAVLAQKYQARPIRGTSQRRNQTSHRLPLAIGVVDEFHAFVGLSRISDKYTEFQRGVVAIQEDRSAGIGWQRLSKFQPHALFADVSAPSRYGRILEGNPDRKIDCESRRTILELLHIRHPGQ
jgi:hypothetical protein